MSGAWGGRVGLSHSASRTSHPASHIPASIEIPPRAPASHIPYLAPRTPHPASRIAHPTPRDPTYCTYIADSLARPASTVKGRSCGIRFVQAIYEEAR